MKLTLKIAGAILLLLVLLLAGGYAYLSLTYRKDFSAFPEPSIKASSDSAVIARGEYLANAVAHCSACHQTFTGKEEREGTKLNLDFGGGYVWDIPMFGRFVAANLSSDPVAGIGALSDGRIARTIRNGLLRDGHIAGFMSFTVGPMADEDLAAVISYLRTIKPVRNEHPAESMGLFAKLVMKKLDPGKREPIPEFVREGGMSVERGRYLANGPAMCFGCHSVADPMDGFALKGPRFQGAAEADPDAVDPAFEICAPNLTPDSVTGHIARWTEADFLKRFRAGVVLKGSTMPWENFARMTDDDLRSIYAYLKTLAPVRHATGPTRRPKGSWKAPLQG